MFMVKSQKQKFHMDEYIQQITKFDCILICSNCFNPFSEVKLAFSFSYVFTV